MLPHVARIGEVSKWDRNVVPPVAQILRSSIACQLNVGHAVGNTSANQLNLKMTVRCIANLDAECLIAIRKARTKRRESREGHIHVSRVPFTRHHSSHASVSIAWIVRINKVKARSVAKSIDPRKLRRVILSSYRTREQQKIAQRRLIFSFIHPHIIHQHLITKVGIRNRAAICPANGHIQNDVHGVRKRPIRRSRISRFGVFKVGVIDISIYANSNVVLCPP